MEFVHLHTHSHYSLLDGLGKIDQLVSAAAKHGMKALALTDHGTLYGAIEFYQKCQAAGIKPIIGVEGYLSAEPITSESKAGKPYHLILLAKNKTGYKNLLKLTTIAHLQGFYYKPRFDWDLLQQYHEGLIALTGCLNGPLSRPLAEQNPKLAEENLDRLLAIFEPEDLYIELQYRPSLSEFGRVNAGLKKLATERKLNLIATNDVHYINQEDALAHDILICLQTKSKLSDTNRMSYIGEDYSLTAPETMAENFSDTPEALENSVKIAERCNLELEFGKINLPEYSLPPEITAEQYLKQLCHEGIWRRYQTNYEGLPDTAKNRLDYELEVISKTGFAAYFLIVQDFVNWAKANGVVVGPGRGSAAGSLVSYLINITNIDPIVYNLLFERFLNPERVSMPDIDMDFADTRRDEVLKYVESKYGNDRVSQIITFGTMAARAAVRDVGRVLGYSYSFCDRIAKLIPTFSNLEDALTKVQELKQIYDQDSETKKLIDAARQLEGVARHASTHACAVLITKEPLVNYVPLQYSSADDQTIISQYSMHPVEDLGLLKMDFLGLKNLTILETAMEIIEKTTGEKINLEKIPLADDQTFKLLQRGDTTGIFQLESSGMTRYLRKLKPSSIEDIIAMISLYRPGPMEFIDQYINGKHGQREVTYLHPLLEPILSKTYGIAVYQEQIMEIARNLAGFTYGQADILRKAVGKKIKKLLDEQEDLMIQGMVKNNIAQETAQKIWDFIVPFARYGFNRSHAASYAMISYQTAYLKAHYPAQFMAALLTADLANADKVARQVQECRKMGINVLPPDVNESYSIFTVVVNPEVPTVFNKIRFGLNAIKNVGEHISKAIIHERKANGQYQSLADFLRRITDKDLNKKSLESLIKCGALDSLGERGIMLFNLDKLLLLNKKMQTDLKLGRGNLFADLPLNQNTAELKLDPALPASNLKKLTWEKELLGLYVSDHPFKQYLPALAGRITPLINLRGQADGQSQTVAGIITNVHKIITRSGEPMLFITIEDSTTAIELIIFPKLLKTTGHLWQNGIMVKAQGKISSKDNEPKLIADSVSQLTEQQLQSYQQTGSTRLWLRLPHGFTKNQLAELKKILQSHQGTIPVYMIIQNGAERKLRTPFSVNYSEEAKIEIEHLIGADRASLEK